MKARAQMYDCKMHEQIVSSRIYVNGARYPVPRAPLSNAADSLNELVKK